MLASIAAAPFFFSARSTTMRMAAGGRPIIAAMAPRATMLGRPFSIVPAISDIGSAAWRGLFLSRPAGASPWAGSPTIRLAAVSGISAEKRVMLSQSMAISRWKLSSWDMIGSVAKRSMAAASPPRICGPEERLISAYQPARAAASSSSEPAVTTPAPPLPAMVSETLCTVTCFLLVLAHRRCRATRVRPFGECCCSTLTGTQNNRLNGGSQTICNPSEKPDAARGGAGWR